MKARTPKPITTAQIQKIHVLLNQQGLIEEKPTIVHSISDGRTQSTKELTNTEAGRLIEFLQPKNAEYEKKCYAVFCAIYTLAYAMDILYGDTEEDHLMNKAKLDRFCRERGTVKKNIAEQSLIELRKTQRQFEAIQRTYKNRKERQP